MKFDAAPAVKLADIKKEVGKYKFEKASFKITSKVVEKTVEKEKKYVAGTFLLADEAGDSDDCIAKVAEFLKAKKTVLVLTGVVSEDDKGRQTIALTKVDELTKK